MDLLLILTYSSVCFVVFKVFKVPVNKWTVPTAGLGGVVMLGTLLLLMNYNHPYTKVARIVTITTPIVPTVRGRVIEVPVEPNTPLVAGDVLFKIDPTVYEVAFEQARAQLADASQDVKGDAAAWDQARATTTAAEADRDRAKENYDRFQAGAGSVFSESEIQNSRDAFSAAEAKWEASKAAESRAKLTYEAEIDGENPEVARLRAALEKAEYDLDETTVRASTDGMVTQVALRPGMMAVPLPLSPVMVFVHEEEQKVVASFLQNSLQRVHAGDEAEVVFHALPGKVFAAKVVQVLPVIAQGSYQATGRLQALEATPGRGRAPVIIELEDDLSEYQLPGGVTAEVAVYTHHFHHVAIMRKILFRMKSWQNFLFGEGH
jgi:multidrug resistance efflux pump